MGIPSRLRKVINPAFSGPYFLNTGSIRAIFGGEILMQVTPLYDRLLVKRLAEEEKTKGGIIVPDSAKEKPAQGEVIAAGNGRISDDGKLAPLTVKKGDKILFGKYSGNEVKINGEELLIIREEEVLGIIH
jgi:chaperonin GroES